MRTPCFDSLGETRGSLIGLSRTRDSGLAQGVCGSGTEEIFRVDLFQCFASSGRDLVFILGAFEARGVFLDMRVCVVEQAQLECVAKVVHDTWEMCVV